MVAILSRPQCLNSLRPSEAYLRRWTNHHRFRLWLVASKAPSHYLNQCWMLLIWPLGTNFSEILIRIQTFSFKKMHLRVLSEKWCPFCLSLNDCLIFIMGNSYTGRIPSLCWNGSLPAMWILCSICVPLMCIKPQLGGRDTSLGSHAFSIMTRHIWLQCNMKIPPTWRKTVVITLQSIYHFVKVYSILDEIRGRIHCSAFS